MFRKFVQTSRISQRLVTREYIMSSRLLDIQQATDYRTAQREKEEEEEDEITEEEDEITEEEDEITNLIAYKESHRIANY